jgi:response regulator RpfG family c-di-GMP phosphodiesterase
MSNKLKCIMLVDDNHSDNFFHEREIKKHNPAINVISKNSGKDGLDYLRTTSTTENILPELIFLDINMPGMNGWEFLNEYHELKKEVQSKVIVIMLTTSDNPDDEAKAKNWDFISDFITKPLTKEIMEDLVDKYF